MKRTPRRITDQERNERRVLRLTVETVRVLHSEALAQAMSGCETTSYTTDKPQGGSGNVC
jgi:hypothetical protein